MARIYYDSSVEPVPVVIAGNPPIDQSAQVAALTAQVATLTAANGALQAKIDAAKAALA